MYRDRPRAAWPVTDDGTAGMDTLSLSLDPLHEASTGVARLPSGTDLGHVHLEVSSLSATRSFYVDGLGLNVRLSMPSALFLAFGDYHHHVGCNVWNGRTEPAAGRGLARVELVVDDPEAIRARLDPATVAEREGGFEARDPDGLTIRVRRA